MTDVQVMTQTKVDGNAFNATNLRFPPPSSPFHIANIHTHVAINFKSTLHKTIRNVKYDEQICLIELICQTKEEAETAQFD